MPTGSHHFYSTVSRLILIVDSGFARSVAALLITVPSQLCSVNLDELSLQDAYAIFQLLSI
tara:strand:- start:573 stop:755 length:183 start_codon:yes stop_codon:yes gene_type:complete